MILHIDMDAFYAAIEQRDQPALRGQPVVVGGGGGRGVVAAASYEARHYGIHSAMSGRRAAQLCPHAVFVRGRIDYYADVGRQVREIFNRYTPIIQPLSLDEAFLDVSGSRRLFGDAATIGRAIKDTINRELDLTASVGVAPLKFVAKIASDLDKPDGFVEVAPDSVLDFLDPLPIARLWGVGRVGQERLERLGMHHFKDIRVSDLEHLKRTFGRWGEHLWRLANGIDPRQVVPDHRAKQIGHERTFADDLSDREMLDAVVAYLCEQVMRRLRHSRRQAKTVSLKYRREDFQTFSHAETLARATDSTQEVLQTALRLLHEMRRRQPRPVRLIGVSVGSLTEPDAPRQLSLFDLSENESSQQQVDQIVDQLTRQHGKSAVYRAVSHSWINRNE